MRLTIALAVIVGAMFLPSSASACYSWQIYTCKTDAQHQLDRIEERLDGLEVREHSRVRVLDDRGQTVATVERQGGLVEIQDRRGNVVERFRVEGDSPDWMRLVPEHVIRP